MVKPLEARKIEFAYESDVPILRGVDLRLDPGELLALIGPNGAGKTTLIRVLAGILGADAGDVHIGDRSLAALSTRDRARDVALVPQELRLPGDVTVETFVEGGRYAHLGFFRRAALEDRQAVDRALDATELTELRTRRLAEMSSGQRQRVLMARAMAQQARTLLVDEPTASLDARHQIQTFELLLDLVRRDHSALVITHELNLASQFATRVALLHEGRIAATGTPVEIFRADVLEPVYGPDLHYGELATSPWNEPRPFVVPWKRG